MKTDIGISEENKKDIAKNLSCVLADSYVLYLKNQNYHWNVTGPFFCTLHELFEQQYKNLAEAIDDIAERIRSLGEYAPAGFSRFQKLSSIQESSGILKAEKMVENLIADYEVLIKTTRNALSIAEKGKDESTIDLLVQQLAKNEKTIWVLKSFLE